MKEIVDFCFEERLVVIIDIESSYGEGLCFFLFLYYKWGKGILVSTSIFLRLYN